MEPYKTFSSPAAAGSFLGGKEDMAEAIKALFDETGISNPLSAIDPQNYRLNRRGKLQYQHDLAEAQYLAEMQLMMYQNEYNSPEAQAQRQRDAGINPDLVGVDGAPAAGMPGNVITPDMAGIETNGQRALGIVDTAFTLMSAAVSGFSGLSSLIRDLEGKDLDNMSKMFSAVPAIGDALGQVYGRKLSYAGPDLSGITGDYLRHAPRRYRRSLNKYITDYVATPRFTQNVYDSDTSLKKSRGENAKTSVDPRYAGEFKDLQDRFKPLQEAEFEVAKMLLKGEQSKAEKMADYWGTRNMTLQASSENSQARAAKGEADIQETIRAGALKTVKNLEKAMHEGKIWATTALAALYASMSGALNLPSLGFSSNSSRHTDPNTGQIVNSSNSAWNFGK